MNFSLFRKLVFFIFLLPLAACFDFAKFCPYPNQTSVWIKKLPRMSLKDSINLIKMFDEPQAIPRGSGQFGEVREVLIEEANKRIAIKRVARNQIEANELEILMTLNGLGITPEFYLCAKNTDFFYLGQQLMSQTLDQITVITAITLKPTPDAFAFFRTFLIALIKLHDKRIIHNDIKPANLMTDDDILIVFLIDMGVAQLFSNELNNFSGSPYYMSISRQTSSTINTLSDFYAAALTIGVIYSSLDDMFKRLPEPEFEYQEIPALCFQADKRNWGPFGTQEALSGFCVKNLKQNLINALAGRFGAYEPSSPPETMNFLTLLVKMIEYETSSLSEAQIKQALSNLANFYNVEALKTKKPVNVFEQPPDEALENPNFQHSRSINEQRKILELEITQQINTLKEDNLNKEDLEQIKSNFKAKIKALNQAERAYVKKTRAWQDNPELLERKIGIPPPAKITADVANKKKFDLKLDLNVAKQKLNDFDAAKIAEKYRKIRFDPVKIAEVHKKSDLAIQIKPKSKENTTEENEQGLINKASGKNYSIPLNGKEKERKTDESKNVAIPSQNFNPSEVPKINIIPEKDKNIVQDIKQINNSNDKYQRLPVPANRDLNVDLMNKQLKNIKEAAFDQISIPKKLSQFSQPDLAEAYKKVEPLRRIPSNPVKANNFEVGQVPRFQRQPSVRKDDQFLRKKNSANIFDKANEILNPSQHERKEEARHILPRQNSFDHRPLNFDYAINNARPLSNYLQPKYQPSLGYYPSNQYPNFQQDFRHRYIPLSNNYYDMQFNRRII